MFDTYTINENNVEKPLIADINRLNAKPEIKIISSAENILEFDIKNVSPSYVNAIRRILLSELPTMGVDRILMEFNTSVIADEILSSRIGLIPIQADPTEFMLHSGEETAQDPDSTIIFQLKVRGKEKQNTATIESDFTLVDKNVYSQHLKWIPIGDQLTKFNVTPPCPVHPDILIVKLNPGQEIDLTVYCHKGVGGDHAKFSPVATAFYRMMPYIKIKEPIYDDDARILHRLFGEAVIDLVSIPGDHVQAFVTDNIRNATNTNVVLYESLKNKVEIGRLQNYYIFKIESTGCIPPQMLVKQAIQVLVAKCDKFIRLSETEWP